MPVVQFFKTFKSLSTKSSLFEIKSDDYWGWAVNIMHFWSCILWKLDYFLICTSKLQEKIKRATMITHGSVWIYEKEYFGHESDGINYFWKKKGPMKLAYKLSKRLEPWKSAYKLFKGFEPWNRYIYIKSQKL